MRFSTRSMIRSPHPFTSGSRRRKFGESYGVSTADLATVTRWIESHGLHVEGIAPSHMFVEFSGPAGRVGETFHTSIHRLSISGESHFANMTDPQIPAGLAGVVEGVHALHDFMPRPMHKDIGPVQRDKSSGRWGFVGAKPAFTIPDGTSTFYAVAPGDFASIYNLNPLFAVGNAGAGQTIAVVEDTDLANVSDVASFRSAFGLSSYAGTFTQVSPAGSITCSLPVSPRMKVRPRSMPNGLAPRRPTPRSCWRLAQTRSRCSVASSPWRT